MRRNCSRIAVSLGYGISIQECGSKSVRPVRSTVGFVLSGLRRAVAVPQKLTRAPAAGHGKTSELCTLVGAILRALYRACKNNFMSRTTAEIISASAANQTVVPSRNFRATVKAQRSHRNQAYMSSFAQDFPQLARTLAHGNLFGGRVTSEKAPQSLRYERKNDWWTHQDLNLGPLACEASALTGLSYASTEKELLRHRDAARKRMSSARSLPPGRTLRTRGLRR
jgi:hypothetical protein